MKNMFNINDPPCLPMFEKIGQIEHYQIILIEEAIVDISRNFVVAVVDMLRVNNGSTDKAILWTHRHRISHVMSLVNSNIQDVISRDIKYVKEKAEKYIITELLGNQIDQIVLEDDID